MAALRTPKVNNIRLTLEGSDLSRLCFQLESAITGQLKCAICGMSHLQCAPACRNEQKAAISLALKY
jgi:hypothetical protein